MSMIWKSHGIKRSIKSFGGVQVREGGAILQGFLLSIKDIGMFFFFSHVRFCVTTNRFCSRFLRMASNKSNANRTVTFADPPSSSYFVSVSVPIARLNSETMDVAFVKAMNPQNYPGGLTAMQEDHRFGSAVQLGRHWAYKYVLDMDGMSYSGRFMAFLASDSAVVKSTVYEEYFSDWIQPWCVYLANN
jgi:hypothetical protein